MRTEITEAVQSLGIADVMHLVEPHRYRPILERIIESRTHLSRDAVSALWWWEALREPVAFVQPDDPVQLLTSLVPSGELVWFVVEANSSAKKEGNFWLYETNVATICVVLREIPSCEYYIVARKCEWLLCENHHGLLIASGEPMVSRVKKIFKALS